jgi:hypothetical protein
MQYGITWRMRVASPDMLQDVASTAIVLGSDFEYSGRTVIHAVDGWPELSIEAQMRVMAFGIVACSEMASDIRRVIFSGGIQAPGPSGDLVDEAGTMEHFFWSQFNPSVRKGIVVVKDADCNTTRTSAQSVHRLLHAQWSGSIDDAALTYPLITSEAHGPRAMNEFSEREGIPVKLYTAEQILLNAAEFGWEHEKSAQLNQQTNAYLHSWRGRRMKARERLYRIASSSPLGDIAEHSIATRRATV